MFAHEVDQIRRGAQAEAFALLQEARRGRGDIEDRIEHAKRELAVMQARRKKLEP